MNNSIAFLQASLRGTKQSLHMQINVTDFIFIFDHGFPTSGCVYIMTNKFHKVLYVGVTSNIIGRVYDDKNKTYPDSFTAKYNCNKLVYYMFYPHIEEAIAVEKAVKGGNRKSKMALVNSINPDWKDLYDDLLD